jgi:hypothetical protein
VRWEPHLRAVREHAGVRVQQDRSCSTTSVNRHPCDGSQIHVLIGLGHHAIPQRLAVRCPRIAQPLQTVGVFHFLDPRHLSAPRQASDNRVQMGQSFEYLDLSKKNVDVILRRHGRTVARVASATKSEGIDPGYPVATVDFGATSIGFVLRVSKRARITDSSYRQPSMRRSRTRDRYCHPRTPGSSCSHWLHTRAGFRSPAKRSYRSKTAARSSWW